MELVLTSREPRAPHNSLLRNLTVALATSLALAACAPASETTEEEAAATDSVLLRGEYYAPWAGGIAREVGGGHGVSSHPAPSAQYAWDFYPVRRGVSGDEINAVAAGTVRRIRNTGGMNCTSGISCTNTYGNYVVIEHDFGGRRVASLYLHLANEAEGSSPRALRVGDRVARGQLIGHMAATGYSWPANFVHLHFQFQELCASYFCTTVDYRTLNPDGFRDVGLLRTGAIVRSGNYETAPPPPPPPPPAECPPGIWPIWTCASDLGSRARCVDGRVETDRCTEGCERQASGTDDVCRAPVPSTERLDIRNPIAANHWITQCLPDGASERVWQTRADGGTSDSRWADFRWPEAVRAGCGAVRNGMYPLILTSLPADALPYAWILQCVGRDRRAYVYRVDSTADGRPAASYQYSEAAASCP